MACLINLKPSPNRSLNRNKLYFVILRHPFPNLLPKYKFVGAVPQIAHTLKMRLIKDRYNSGKTISGSGASEG